MNLNLHGKAAWFALAVLSVVGTVSALTLEEGFKAPPPDARPQELYFMMNGNVTKEGITCDFEAIAKAGLGGMLMMDIASAHMPYGEVEFNTPEWFALMRHAHNEAKRLGLEMSMTTCSGWATAGGPWNVPSNAMKKVVYTETRLKGPVTFRGRLPRTKEDNGFYDDIAVLAFPTPSGNLRLSRLENKTYVKRGPVNRDEGLRAEADQIVPKGRILDLTARMSGDGQLEWEVPDGDWTILRVGYVCNGVCNRPAARGGKGLEVDKLSASALEFHAEQYAARLCKEFGVERGTGNGERGTGLTGIEVDSYEAGSQNWTQGFEKKFEERMGYSLLPYLPVFSGRIVGSVDESERFLEDFRRVVSDLLAENFSGALAAFCHRHGVKFLLEPYGKSVPADNLQYGRHADIPMSEFWSRSGVGEHVVDEKRYIRIAAHVAHVWGKRYAGAESFTADPSLGGRWRATPFGMKAQTDRAFAQGINRIVYHRFTHQPWPGNQYLPGMTMGRWGSHIDRTQTWWHIAPEWFRYQSRCQWMLQEGTFVADVLYFCGENVPNAGATVFSDTTGKLRLPAGYDWDICSADALEELKVVDGRIVVPGGVSYALLVLPLEEAVSERVLKSVNRLLDAGAKVCAPVKPTRAFGLRGFPESDARIRASVDETWKKGVLACRPAVALKRLGIAPDFASTETDPKSGAAYIHRRSAAADWYFVALNNETNVTFEASFRITGKAPEIWDAETGEICDAANWRVEGGRTVVAMEFKPSGSAFVVFRRGTGNGEQGMATSTTSVQQQESVPFVGPWQVTIPVDWYTGGNAVKTFTWPSLKDWTSDDDPDVKYFSGTVTYSKRFALPPPPVGQSPRDRRVFLDLGEVKNFAEVTVNGKSYPPLWRPPFRLDITDAVKTASVQQQGRAVAPRPPLSFDLEIKVTNLWPNRLIGDDALPEDCEWKGTIRNGLKEIGVKEIPQWVKDGKRSPTGRHTFTTWRHWAKDEDPLPSGLLGPVQLQFACP